MRYVYEVALIICDKDDEFYYFSSKRKALEFMDNELEENEDAISAFWKKIEVL